MNILLDTHVAIWALVNRARLGAPAIACLEEFDNDVYVSAIAVWEIAIKNALPARLDAPPFSGAEAQRHFSNAGFKFLDITPRHAAAVETLPLHHADPFDRLLIAQALTEPMRLMTADRNVAKYSDTIILL